MPAFRRRQAASSLIPVLFAFCIVLLTVGTALGQGKTILGKPLPKKIMDSVAIIQNAKSLDQITEALKSVRFSESEMQQLADEVKRRGLNTKLENMRQSAEAAKKKTPPVKVYQPDQVLKQKQAALDAQRSQFIQRMNKQALAAKPKVDPAVRSLTGLTTASAAPVRTLTQSQWESLTTAAASRRTAPAGTGRSVTFTNVPDGVVGQDMTVEGRGFGNTPGRVAVIVDRQLFYCPVSTWMDTRVTFRLTEELQPYVGYSQAGRRALLWFKEPDREVGPTREIVLHPDPARTNPVITAIVPGEIRPGQTVLITGRNFVTYNITRRPNVDFIFPDMTRISGRVQSSGDDFIQVEFPGDFGGKARSQIRVLVKNTIDLNVNSNLTFVPAEEIIHIPSRNYTAQSQPRGGPLFFISLFGESHTHTLHDWELKNGWVVEDCHLEVRSIGINSGAFYELRPTTGSTLAKAIINIWADAYSSANCLDHLYLRGPRGVPYR